MLFHLSTRDTASVLRIEGELDAMSVPDLRPAINRIAVGRPRQVFVDLSGLRMIDATGVGAIISLFKAVRSDGGKMEVLGVREQPLAMLRLLKLDRVLAGQSAHRRQAPTIGAENGILRAS
jgi:anti-sigma B factor antagonist